MTCSIWGLGEAAYTQGLQNEYKCGQEVVLWKHC